jgi:hypothetical protein
MHAIAHSVSNGEGYLHITYMKDALAARVTTEHHPHVPPPSLG